MRKSLLWKHFLHLIEGYKRDGVQRASKKSLWTTKNNKRLCQLSREMNSWRWQKGSASESSSSESSGLSSELRITGQRTAGNEDRCWWSEALFQGRLKAGLKEICWNLLLLKDWKLLIDGVEKWWWMMGLVMRWEEKLCLCKLLLLKGRTNSKFLRSFSS